MGLLTDANRNAHLAQTLELLVSEFKIKVYTALSIGKIPIFPLPRG